jgi:flavin reductase (DIM6/NTAB) family NADH-FMN oxidoreductase RutF
MARPHLKSMPAQVPEPAAHEFAEAMSALASGVAIVTCLVDGRPWGMTVTAFTSVSAVPPTVLVSLGAGSTSARAIAASGRFGLSLLAQEHRYLARYASARGAAKFLEAFTDPVAGGESPEVVGAPAHLDCELVDQLAVHDHVVFVGRVRRVHAALEGRPLLYYRRAYHELAGPLPARLLPERRIECLSS